MLIFLTGGTGYIGGAVARRLAADGHELRALVRRGSANDALAELTALGAELVVGDLLDPASLRPGVEGAQAVIHCAADLDFAGPERRMAQTNVSGSAELAALARQVGVDRFVALSSIAAWGGSPDSGRPAREETPRRRALGPYGASKRAGEEAVLAEAAAGLPVNIVYPSLVYGPPAKGSGANLLLRQMVRRRLPAVVGGDRLTSWVYIDDLVEGILAVLNRAPAGRHFLLAGEVISVADLVARTCRLAQVRPPRYKLSPATARFLDRMSAPLLRALGKRRPFQPEQLASLGRHWAFDDLRARRELGWSWRPLEEGLPPTVRHLARRKSG